MQGVRYVYQYLQEVNPGSNLGNSIARAYPDAGVLDGDDEATARAKIEQQIQRHAREWTWHADGSLEVVHYVEAIKRHPLTGVPVYFGNITSMFLLAQKWAALEPPFLGTDGAFHHLPTYGDGSAIPHRYLQLCADLIQETRVLIDWRVGDVLVLDNHLVRSFSSSSSFPPSLSARPLDAYALCIVLARRFSTLASPGRATDESSLPCGTARRRSPSRRPERA